ncbi:MAG: ABC transporter permease [Solirubrobacterales bacterium]|nr:ABC transporter permease [Solirubrobacterales bacterium]
MFHALRDLRRSGRRFLLVGTVIALIAMLSTVLVGLTEGLVKDGTSGLRELPLDHLAMQDGSDAVFSRSTLGARDLEDWSGIEGVEVSPLGVSFANAASVGNGPNVDIALFGVPPDSFLVEREEGREALSGRPGIVLASETKDEGVEVGDRFRFAGSDRPLPVLGFTFAGSYGHVPVGYVDIGEWREITYGSRGTDRFSAVAMRLPDGADTAPVERRTGTELLTKDQAFDGSPGYSAEMSTMSLIRFFLLLISALVVGAFFTVLIVERRAQIGLLRAMGATGGYVMRDGIGQMAVIQLAATVLGCGAGLLVILALDGGPVPVSLSLGGTAVAALLLIVAGLLGTLVSLRRVSRIEPATALSGAEA